MKNLRLVWSKERATAIVEEATASARVALGRDKARNAVLKECGQRCFVLGMMIKFPWSAIACSYLVNSLLQRPRCTATIATSTQVDPIRAGR